MPTTSSPWASPSSPAGRRLLQSEPATADDIPVLDEATLALGAALVAAAPAAERPAAGAARPHAAAARARSWLAPVAAAVAVVALALGATTGLDRPAPAASGPVPGAPLALGRAAGSALGVGTVPAPVRDGQVVVALIDPTAAVGATPVALEGETLAGRLGTLVALAAEDASAG